MPLPTINTNPLPFRWNDIPIVNVWIIQLTDVPKIKLKELLEITIDITMGTSSDKDLGGAINIMKMIGLIVMGCLVF